MKLPDPIKQLIENYCGINYELIGKASLESLVKNRRAFFKLPSDDDYFNLLLTSRDEFNNFVEGLLIPETWFFRDTNPFIHLNTFSNQFDKNRTFLRILSIPCATGEETYSIAITLINSGWSPTNFSVYGVDISQKFIDIAQEGIYSKKSFYPQDPCDKSKYFDQINNQFSIKNDVRRAVHFMHGNIIDSTLFNNAPPFHAIFARNILIYFSIEARKKVLANLDRLLLPNGLLFLGHADNISLLSDKFKPTGHPSAFVFEKSTTATREYKHPITQITLPRKQRSLLSPTSPTSSAPNLNLLEKAQELANLGLFQQAETYCNDCINSHGPSPDVYFLLGQIFAAQNNLDSAEHAYKKTIYLDNNHIDALFQLELLYLTKGDNEQAKILHDRLIRVKANK